MTAQRLDLTLEFASVGQVVRFLAQPPDGVRVVAEDPPSVAVAPPEPSPPRQLRDYAPRGWSKAEDDEILAAWARWPKDSSASVLGHRLSPRLNRSGPAICQCLRILLRENGQ